jgi:hypothetical protein
MSNMQWDTLVLSFSTPTRSRTRSTSYLSRVSSCFTLVVWYSSCLIICTYLRYLLATLYLSSDRWGIKL